MYIKLSPFRNCPPEVFSKKDALRHEVNPQKEHQQRSTSSTKALCNFVKITPMHRYAPGNPQHIHKTPPLRENTSGGLILHVKRILKDLKYEKFLFTVVKINLLAIKMDK